MIFFLIPKQRLRVPSCVCQSRGPSGHKLATYMRQYYDSISSKMEVNLNSMAARTDRAIYCNERVLRIAALEAPVRNGLRYPGRSGVVQAMGLGR